VAQAIIDICKCNFLKKVYRAGNNVSYRTFCDNAIKVLASLETSIIKLSFNYFSAIYIGEEQMNKLENCMAKPAKRTG